MSHFSFSLSKLISSLINQPNAQEYISLPDEEIKPTTIRLEPAVRKFCDDQALKMGISVQAFIAMVLNGVMLESTNPVKSELLLIYERFFEVFKMHSIMIADIPAVLKRFHLTLSTLTDKNKLLDMLNDELISYMSDFFIMNPEWLKGASNQARTSDLRWYKNTFSFCSHLLDLKNNNLSPEIMLIKSDKTNLEITDDSTKIENHIIPIIRMKKEYLSGKYFNCYQAGEHGAWSYWRGRYHLKSIILFCHLSGISLGGYTLKFKCFTNYIATNEFAHVIANKASLGGYNWYPESYIDQFESDYPGQQGEDELYMIYDEFFATRLDQLLAFQKLSSIDGKLKKLSAKHEQLSYDHKLSINKTTREPI